MVCSRCLPFSIGVSWFRVEHALTFASFVVALFCVRLVVPARVAWHAHALSCVRLVVPAHVAWHAHVPSKNVGTKLCGVLRVC